MSDGMGAHAHSAVAIHIAAVDGAIVLRLLQYHRLCHEVDLANAMAAVAAMPREREFFVSDAGGAASRGT